MNSRRPYLIRALYEWIADNDCTPCILVNAMADGVIVPGQFVEDGQIVLNVSATAIIDLLIDNSGISFNGRFSGVPTDIYVPMHAVMSVFARENGQGMVFEQEDPVQPDPPEDTGQPRGLRSVPNGKPSLKVVK